MPGIFPIRYRAHPRKNSRSATGMRGSPHLIHGSFLAPTRVHIPTVSAVLAELTVVTTRPTHTHTQTHRQRYMICSNNNTTTTFLRPLYRLRTGGFCWCKVFTARMPLLAATSACGLGRRRWSSHQHCLRSSTSHNNKCSAQMLPVATDVASSCVCVYAMRPHNPGVKHRQVI